MVFLSKTNVMIKILHNLGSFVLSQKRQFFCRIFGQKYLKNRSMLGAMASMPAKVTFDAESENNLGRQNGIENKNSCEKISNTNSKRGSIL
jgi:hypothetical protein